MPIGLSHPPDEPVVSTAQLPWTRSHTVALLGVLLLALVMRAFFLDFPSGKFFDEIYYVPAAHDYLAGRPDANSVHPPLAKIQLAATMLVFEGLKYQGWHNIPDEVGWRLLPLLSGVGVVALSAWLAQTLLRNARISVVTALLVAVDHLSVSESRITTLDNIQAFWITLAIVCAAQRLFRSAHFGWVVGCAVCVGIATACKWNGLFAGAGVGLALWGLVWHRPADAPPLPHRGAVLLTMALLVGGVYAASYIPYRVIHPQKSLAEIVKDVRGQHERMVKFRYDPKQFKHQYISQFYEWPIVKRPIWFHFKSEDAKCTGIVAFGLIPFWWLAFFLVLECLLSAWRRTEADPVGQFLVITYLLQWLPWFTSTTGGFFYYMLPLVPLMAVLVARQAVLWWDTERRWAYIYAVVLGLHVVLYFPFMCGMKVPYKYFQALFFYKGWY